MATNQNIAQKQSMLGKSGISIGHDGRMSFERWNSISVGQGLPLAGPLRHGTGSVEEAGKTADTAHVLDMIHDRAIR